MKLHPSNLHRSLTLATVFGVIPVLSACSTRSELRHDGYVADVAASDVRLRLCFEGDAAPSVGQDVQLVRTVKAGDPKMPAISYQDIGVARITAAASEDRCFAATLTEGGAQRFDHVRLPQRR